VTKVVSVFVRFRAPLVLEESIFIETTGLGHSLHDDGLYKKKSADFILKLNKPIHSTTNLSSYSNKQSSLQTIKQFSLTFAVWKKTSNINKFIGETGYCSRREADKIIEEVA
jgi:hypothetical protein